jgi:acetolactate synthase-1/2/3 large subunit
MVKKLPAELIAEFLQEKKISHVFDIAGGMIAYIEDAISRKHGIKCLPCRHEQGCGFSAEGYARVSQNFGVAMATSGPGATNLITAIGSCYFDSVPTLFITGQVHTEHIRKDIRVRQLGFQETDIVSVIRPLTKYAVQLLKAEQVMYELEKALFIAQSGRKGPVLMDIPIDVQRTEVEVKKLKSFYGSPEHAELLKAANRSVATNVANKLGKMLKNSKRPIVLVGGGIRLSQTTSGLKDFVERNNLPVVSSLMGLDSFPGKHPLFAGFIGSYGTRHANMIFANSDLIISLGSRIDVRQTGSPKFFAKNAIIVHVDIDPYSIGANIKAQMPVVADLKAFFLVCKKMSTPPKNNWLEFVRQVKNKFGPVQSKLSNKINPNSAVEDICAAASAQAVVSVDVGNHQMWTAQSWLSQPGQRLLFSGVWEAWVLVCPWLWVPTLPTRRGKIF